VNCYLVSRDQQIASGGGRVLRGEAHAKSQAPQGWLERLFAWEGDTVQKEKYRVGENLQAEKWEGFSSLGQGALSATKKRLRGGAVNGDGIQIAKGNIGVEGYNVSHLKSSKTMV